MIRLAKLVFFFLITTNTTLIVIVVFRLYAGGAAGGVVANQRPGNPVLPFHRQRPALGVKTAQSVL